MVPVPATALLVTSTRGAVPGYRFIKGAGNQQLSQVPVRPTGVPVPVPIEFEIWMLVPVLVSVSYQKTVPVPVPF